MGSASGPIRTYYEKFYLHNLDIASMGCALFAASVRSLPQNRLTSKTLRTCRNLKTNNRRHARSGNPFDDQVGEGVSDGCFNYRVEGGLAGISLSVGRIASLEESADREGKLRKIWNRNDRGGWLMRLRILTADTEVGNRMARLRLK
jgi:hypothetical protein